MDIGAEFIHGQISTFKDFVEENVGFLQLLRHRDCLIEKYSHGHKAMVITLKN
jgi:hypothetical protein